MSDADDDLRLRFRQLREHDDSAAPPFSSVFAPTAARRSRSWSPLAFRAAAFALAAVAVTSLMLATLETAVDAPSLALPPWPTQTNSLLSSVSIAAPGLSWSSPTSALGQPSFSRYKESR